MTTQKEFLQSYLEDMSEQINTYFSEYHAYVSIAAIAPNLVVHEKVRSFDKE